jgi:hypothetical protein
MAIRFRGGQTARRDKAGGGDISDISEVVDTAKLAGECVDGGGVCSFPHVTQLFDQFVESAGGRKPPGGADKRLVAVKSALECDTESCVLNHKRFQDFVVGEMGEDGRAMLKENLESRFKPEGPRDTKAWFSDKHIDATLRIWGQEFPCFYPYSFNMIDFDSAGGSLAKYSAVSALEGKAPLRLPGGGHGRAGVIFRPCRCMGCVLNTDVSTGPGKHWFSVFVDCRASGQDDFWTVEYFNSSGSRPRAEVVVWMERTKNQLTSYRANRTPTASAARIP